MRYGVSFPPSPVSLNCFGSFADLVRLVDFMQKVDGSPVLIYTTDTPDSSLTKDQYYTVSTITGNSKYVPIHITMFLRDPELMNVLLA